LAARGRGRDRRSRETAHSLSRVDACNPLLQAHPTWARDKNMKAAGFPPPSLAPVALSSPLRAPSHADPSGLGHATTFHSSARGPPGLETPTNTFEVSTRTDEHRDEHIYLYPHLEMSIFICIYIWYILFWIEYHKGTAQRNIHKSRLRSCQAR
jgi:hypothetical protein